MEAGMDASESQRGPADADGTTVTAGGLTTVTASGLEDKNRIRSLNTRTFIAIEKAVMRRRAAICEANARAIRALEPLTYMPPLFTDPHRNRVGHLLKPLECSCTPEETEDLMCLLWQEEKREEWIQQQVRECSSLLKRADRVLAQMKQKTTIRDKSVELNPSGRPAASSAGAPTRHPPATRR